jgi:hypothetical protein
MSNIYTDARPSATFLDILLNIKDYYLIDTAFYTHLNGDFWRNKCKFTFIFTPLARRRYIHPWRASLCPVAGPLAQSGSSHF